MRKAKQDFTLSDGTFIPAGTLVAGASTATHRDARNYDNPEVFDPLRFADMRSEEGASIKHQFVSTSPEYVPFGHGKHAWYVSNVVLCGLYSQTRCVVAPVASSP